jgi:hypothetical protein
MPDNVGRSQTMQGAAVRDMPRIVRDKMRLAGVGRGFGVEDEGGGLIASVENAGGVWGGVWFGSGMGKAYNMKTIEQCATFFPNILQRRAGDQTEPF